MTEEEEQGESLTDTIFGFLADENEQPKHKDNKTNQVSAYNPRNNNKIKATREGNKIYIYVNGTRYWCGKEYLLNLINKRTDYALFFQEK